MASWDYISGFFDGEGCVYLKYGNNGLPKVGICIPQKDRSILDEVQKVTGGSIYTYSDQPCSQLVINKAAEVVNFLEHVLSTTLRRKRKVEIGLALARLTPKVGTNAAPQQEVLVRLRLAELFESEE